MKAMKNLPAVSLAKLATLIRYVDLNPEDEAAITQLREWLYEAEGDELMKVLSIVKKLASAAAA